MLWINLVSQLRFSWLNLNKLQDLWFNNIWKDDSKVELNTIYQHNHLTPTVDTVVEGWGFDLILQPVSYELLWVSKYSRVKCDLDVDLNLTEMLWYDLKCVNKCPQTLMKRSNIAKTNRPKLPHNEVRDW